MILVDSSVWIDQLAGRDTPQTRAVEWFIAEGEPLAVGDLVMAEVLQGTRNERLYRIALDQLTMFDAIVISNHRIAQIAAHHYRYLRDRGITIRKTIDTLIATRCIVDRIPLLYSDRDFDPFVAQLGLVSALDHPGVN